MRKGFFKACALALCLMMTAAFSVGCKDEKEEEQLIIPEGYTQLTIDQSNGLKTEGFGTQIDTHVYKAYNNMTEDEMNEFYKRVKEMNIQCIRTQVFPEWFERDNDNNDYTNFNYNSPNVDMNSIEMTQLYRLLDFCEENDIHVDLSFYGCCATFESQDGKVQGSWLGAKFTKSWITAPKLEDASGNAFPGLEEYTENVYALLSYLLETKKYTCISEFSIYPEPNLSYVRADGRVHYGEYVELVKKVDKRLKDENLRDKIRFSGPAVALQTVMGLNSYINDLDTCFDKYTISSYSYDDKDSNSTLADYGAALQNLVSYTGKTYSLAEFGSKNVIDSCNQTDIETYERALFLARYMINLSNQGCTSMKYWEVFDMDYGGFMMNLGLWKYRKDNWVARPQYYTWSLITKYTDIGSEIYPITKDVTSDNDLVSVAFKLPDGKWSYMICNTSDTPKKLSMVNLNEDKPSAMNVYEVRASKCDGVCTPIASSATLNRENGAINIKVLANSFVVLSER